MKGLKCKVWDNTNKVILDRRCPNLVIHLDGSINGINENGELIGTINTPDLEALHYVGFKDNVGKEIYEGDIIQFTWDSSSCWGKAGTYLGYIKIHDDVFAIEYIGKLKKTRIKNEEEYCDDLKSFIWWTSTFRVIGNIYERPDLLEVKE